VAFEQHDLKLADIYVSASKAYNRPNFAGASIKESRLLVTCCRGTILSKVCVAVTRQRHHGSTAGECEDEDKRCDEDLHGSPRNFQVRFHVQLIEIYSSILHSTNSAANKRAFDRAWVRKNSLFIRI
jgi:hypothetical protein